MSNNYTYNPNATYYPGTTTLVTHNFEERQFTAEFDDALVDQLPWKNPRYDGCKTTAQQINAVTPGDITYQNLPTLTNQSTALFIANSVIGGTEDEQFATLKNHSYVGINKILIIDHDTETLQILDKTTEPFEEFNRFITNNLPTGKRAFVKIIDESIPTNLKGSYRVKMNKGYLLKSFSFKEGGEFSGSAAHESNVLTQNNSMYLYTRGFFKDNIINTGSISSDDLVTITTQSNQLRFRYGVNEMFESNASTNGNFGAKFHPKFLGPSFASSSIFQNKFTQQYHTGSFGFIVDNPKTDDNTLLNSQVFLSTAFATASKFIGIDTLGFLASNNADTSLSTQEKTEVHITFFEGTKDFSKGVSASVSAHDERSIGTFEVDQNRAGLMIEQGGSCNGGLPTNHEIVFKGRNDNRFLPIQHTFLDDIQNAHLQSTASSGVDGCITFNAAIGNGNRIQPGVNVDRVDNAEIFIQGGALGQVGFQGAQSASFEDSFNAVTIRGVDTGGVNDFVTNSSIMTSDNFYSGSFSYELSFLDKDHTLIMDIDKDAELFDGIGDQGLVILADDTHPSVSFNIEFYLAQAGIIAQGLQNPGGSQQNISNNINPTYDK